MNVVDTKTAFDIGKSSPFALTNSVKYYNIC